VHSNSNFNRERQNFVFGLHQKWNYQITINLCTGGPEMCFGPPFIKEGEICAFQCDFCTAQMNCTCRLMVCIERQGFILERRSVYVNLHFASTSFSYEVSLAEYSLLHFEN
jgi:hypothetical protein